MTGDSSDEIPLITTVAEYAGQSAIRLSATQLSPRYSSSDARRIVAEWVEFLAAGPSPIRDLRFVSRTPGRLFDALAGQKQLLKLSVKWGDYEDLSAISDLNQLLYLRLGGASRVRSLSPLSALTGVVELELASLLRARDLSPIGAMHGVTRLEVAGDVWGMRVAHVDSISFLRRMPHLCKLRLDTLVVDDLDYAPILGLPNLESLMVMKVTGMRPKFEELVASTPWDA
jgi:hypothetical protein